MVAVPERHLAEPEGRLREGRVTVASPLELLPRCVELAEVVEVAQAEVGRQVRVVGIPVGQVGEDRDRLLHPPVPQEGVEGVDHPALVLGDPFPVGTCLLEEGPPFLGGRHPSPMEVGEHEVGVDGQGSIEVVLRLTGLVVEGVVTAGREQTACLVGRRGDRKHATGRGLGAHGSGH